MPGVRFWNGLDFGKIWLKIAVSLGRGVSICVLSLCILNVVEELKKFLGVFL